MPHRLLVVDDDDSLRELIKHDCEMNGVDVAGVNNGFDALKEFLRALQVDAPYDGLLIDISLPGLNGIGVARVVRTIERSVPPTKKRCRIAFLSALTAQFELTGAFEEVESTLQLSKPDDMVELGKKLSFWLGSNC